MAVAGTLDTSFGTNGELIIDPGSIFSGGVSPVTTIVQTDGKTIAIGSKFAGSNGYIAQLSRYNLDGSLDSTFGSAGKLTTSLGGYIGTKLQSDGKILVVGTAALDGSILAIRYNSDGSLDNSFGVNGTVTTNLVTNSFNTIDKFFQEAGGRLLVAASDGKTTTTSLYASNGSLDRTFSIPGSNPYTGIEQADGKILVALIAPNSANNILVRYNPDGSLDRSFGYGGSIPVVGGSGNLTRGQLIQQADGKILLNTSGYITRYNLDGSIDLSFGTFGSTRNNLGNMLLEPDGKIIVGDGINSDFNLRRYSDDGILDLSFDTDGVVVKDFNKGADRLSSITLGSDGKIFAAGISANPNSSATNFVVTRFENDLNATTNHAPISATKLESKIVVKGTILDFTLPSNTFSDLDGDSLTYTAKQVNGTALPWLSFNPTIGRFLGTPAGGTSNFGTLYVSVTATDKGGLSATSDFHVSVLTNNIAAQSLDSSFGEKGSYIASSFSGDALPRGEVIQADGKIVVNNSAGSVQLTRYNTDGSRDFSFKPSQIDMTVNDGSRATIQQSDGKILVQGIKTELVNNLLIRNYTVSRFNVDGSVDNAFGTNGTITTDFADSGYFSKLYERNGKIYIVGSASLNQNPLTKPMKLNRYNSDGTLDSSFGTGGSIAINDVGINSESAYDRAYEIEAQSDGKVLIAANIRDAASRNNVYLLRYNSDGSIDSSFGTTGKVTLAIGNNVPPAQIRQTSDGKILVAQSQYLTRYDSNGSIDPSFGTSGVVRIIDPAITETNFQGRFILKLIQTSDSKLVTVTTSTNDHNRVVRYNLDGSIDNSFYGDFSDSPVNITQTSDGKIVVVGDSITQRIGTTGYIKNLVATRYAEGGIVPPAIVNNPPVVAKPIATKTATSGIAFGFTIPTDTVTDPDVGDTLGYTLTLANGDPLPSWLTFDATTRLLSGTPSLTEVGSINLVVKATDRGNLSVNNNFVLSIAANPAVGLPATDFNGDRKSDILWRNADGSVAIWQMNSATATPSSVGRLTTDWRIAGTGDFSGDGKADILLSNPNGRVTTWQMNGAAVTAVRDIGTLTTGWNISGTGDFNGDRKTDMLLSHQDGSVVTWTINRSNVTESRNIGTLTTGWSIAGTGDFNGDFKTDILFRKTTGDVALWQMDGATVVNARTFAVAPMDWSIAGTGDANGDGKADILWRKTNGDVALWQMNGFTVTNSRVVGTTTTDWKIAGTGDFNGDGNSDILWRHDLGGVATWQMNGSTVLSAGATSIPTADPNWSIAAPIG
jgi:uncharacterized delta-60 repeat protein